MDIEKSMQASKEVDYENCNEYFLFIDTDENGIQGDITQYTSGGPGGGTDLDIHLPPGTMADNRWVKLEGPPCHTEIVQDLVGSDQAQVDVVPERVGHRDRRLRGHRRPRRGRDLSRTADPQRRGRCHRAAGRGQSK